MADVVLVANDPRHRRLMADEAKRPALLNWIADHGVNPDDVRSLSIDGDEVTFERYTADQQKPRAATLGCPSVEPVIRPVLSPWPFTPWEDYIDA